MMLLDLQPRELVLQDDGHLVGILLAQEVGNLEPREMRLEGQEEMMRADQPLLLDAR